MPNADRFYIGGEWVAPTTSATTGIVDPSTEQEIGRVALGGTDDVDRAVAAARAAFTTFSESTVDERAALLERVVEVYRSRADDIADVLMTEMGAPAGLAHTAQVGAGLGQFATALDTLRKFAFEETRGTTRIRHEPIGVCGLITPWNWPPLLIAAKVGPALAAGCTMVLKPSELAPLNAVVIAEVLHEAGVPAGVFNLVHGDGPTVGSALAAHPDVDMISFTGSTRAGVEVARNAAPTVKRVAQELGGKSANIILDDADLATVVPRDMGDVVANSGQSCNAGSRWLVPESRLPEVVALAKAAAEAIVVGPPAHDGVTIGPVVSQAAYDKVQRLITGAVDDGATVVAGGLGRPDGLDTGYYVRPTVLSGVTNDMQIAREEIFGPVITILTYRDEDEAVQLANDTEYGLAGFVSSADPERARAIARRMRTGMVHVNGAGLDFAGAFGGYKQSGNGREYADFGLREFLEVKSVFGYSA
ncbi:MAG: aldehyde dehydrogenase family protein [Pseudonocardia sp.]|uniref:aldehyde dehydrogenase family protein n=1 Tax=unclassified Pseudonocardia TaxID=2619320 RepID=UPI00086EB40B|nr:MULTISPECIES: aldehyde dehydrogenase family protein [unclassified Pseudonocardia]MBN9108173.1 aldehyde dehydrogenase family protein [Pseudonocardia sp.]ODU24470.1 MAG: aldehyde dehydrogenase [Pseudonocardia sp. SCN 72-51]ODV01656.1 MAG: aldehyde dehydrogenase [Pseudonocardia sp. SCN 73-27]